MLYGNLPLNQTHHGISYQYSMAELSLASIVLALSLEIFYPI